MAATSHDMAAVVADIDARTAALVATCATLTPAQLDRPTLLPDWSVLTVLCHLRYGAQVLTQITDATLAGQPSAYYPGGRDVQRPFTLRPALGEPRSHVLDSLAAEAEALTAAWSDLPVDAWARPMIATDEADPLGAPTLEQLALLRLVEVMVHGSDLGVGLAPWPLRFGQWVLPLRVQRARIGPEVTAIVRFEAVDTSPITATVATGQVTLVDDGSEPDVVVSGVANDLVALLLGRVPMGGVSMTGDAAAVTAIRRSITGP